MTRRIATVRNSRGHALHCVLEEPPGGAGGAALAAVLLCPGIKTRVGPHRLYRKLSRAFLSRGIPVMRVDFDGLGDSEGELPQDGLEQIYRDMELGRHTDDARSALDWLEAECGIRRAIVGGLCGGAMTGLHLAQRDRRAVALYAIGLPVSLHGTPEARATPMTSGELQYNGMKYLHKLFEPGSWRRLLSLKSDYRLMWRMLSSTVGWRRQAPAKRMVPTVAAGVPAPQSPAPANFNPLFAPAFFSLLASDRPALLIFSQRDRVYWEYEENFARLWSPALAPHQALITKVVIAKANHILGDPAWWAEAGHCTCAWLDRLFPAASGAEPSIAVLAAASATRSGATAMHAA